MLTVANLGLAGIGGDSGVMFELDSVTDTASILTCWRMDIINRN